MNSVIVPIILSLNTTLSAVINNRFANRLWSRLLLIGPLWFLDYEKEVSKTFPESENNIKNPQIVNGKTLSI